MFPEFVMLVCFLLSLVSFGPLLLTVLDAVGGDGVSEGRGGKRTPAS